MAENILNKCVGRYCKIVTKEPGEEKANVITGIIKDIDHDGGFITIESKQGLGMLNIKTIVAIKPKEQEKKV